jgi:hypothetical protein
MRPDSNARRSQSLFLNALQSEITSGSESLAAWIKQIQSQGALESLFALETWLKGLRSFFNVDHLPLSEAEKGELLIRSFAPEIEIVREVIPICETYACQLVNPEIIGELEFEKCIEIQMRKDRIQDFALSRIVQQLTPRDSMNQLLESLNDWRIMIDAFKYKYALNYQLFLSLGRCFFLGLKDCRYIDMLLQPGFHAQYDHTESKLLTSALHRVNEESVRRSLASGLLCLFRFLKYLNLVSDDLERDRPLRRNLVIFSLLHEEMESLSDFLRARVSRSREAKHAVRNASELIAYSLKMESQRVLNRELVLISGEVNPATVYARIEDGHGLLRNCCQSCVVTMIQSIDNELDTTALFPSSAQRLMAAEKLRRDLWDLRQWLKDILSNEEILDSNKIIMRITAFKDASLHSLMYRDWAEFDSFLETLALSANFVEIRTQIRKFTSFLETLIQEVSKRSVFKEKQTAS